MKRLFSLLIVLLMVACKKESQEPIWITTWHSPNHKFNSVDPGSDIKLKTLYNGDVLCKEKIIEIFGANVIDRGYCRQQFYVNDMEVSIEYLYMNRYMKAIDIINAGYDIEFSDEMLKELTPYNLIRGTVFADGRKAYLYELDTKKHESDAICESVELHYEKDIYINNQLYRYVYTGTYCEPETYVLHIMIPTTETGYSLRKFKGFAFTEAIDEGFITPDELEILRYPEMYEKIEIEKIVPEN